VKFVTLAVRDLDAARAFSVEGLGWTPELDVPGEVLMIRVGEGLVLSLWAREAFEAEVGERAQSGPGAVPITLSHTCVDRATVDAALESARLAGAHVVSRAQDRDWGGYSGYLADPDGFRWEVAWNPGPIGQTVLPGVSTDG
jgi:catechol 2,3-dioxygenase-like lactoylglutathione lyase family enzyme